MLCTLHYALFIGGEAAPAQGIPVDVPTIETIAGIGILGDIGDGGAATAALLYGPIGVAVDGAGNVYFADSFTRIRKVDASTGNISTVAGTGTAGDSGDGGAATAAQLNHPLGVAVDAAGNLYIADLVNHRIRKVDTSTGIISTVAGTGTAGYSGDGAAAAEAQLSHPWDVTADGSGNLYIADALNHRIRKVDTAGVITTIAGTGAQSYGGDGGAATSAQINYPHGVAADSSGNLYIAEGNRIRKVDASTGNITTVAGTGTQGYSGDGGAATAAQINGATGVAADGSGNLYIADYNNQRIRKVDASTGIISTVAGIGAFGYSGDGAAATAAQLFHPWDVTVDGAGNLYITDSYNGRIRKVDASTGNISTVAGTGGSIGDGGAATAAQLNSPQGLALDGAGNLYIADAHNDRIRKVDASTGIISTVAGIGTFGYSGGDGGAATAALLRFPAGVAVDGEGNLYIADWDNHRIRKVDASTGNISTVAGTTQGYSGDGGAATSAQINYPDDVAVDGSGNLYIANGNNRIRKVDASTGIISTVAGTGAFGYSGDGGPATSAQIRGPSGMAVDGAGNLYFADWGNHRIRKVDASTGIISTVAGIGAFNYSGYSGDGGAATAAQLNSPQGLTLDSAGALYIADSYNHRIRKVDAAGVITTFAGTGMGGPDGDGGAPAEAQLNSPVGLAFDSAGALYIADSGNHRIRKIAAPPPPSASAPSAPEPEPEAQPVGVSELSFAPAPNADPGEPMSQTLTLRAEGGAVDFQALPSARWIEVSRAAGSVAQWRGRLAEGETITLRVTVNPLGLRPGTHRGRLYIRSGGRITATIRIVLEVPPPTGPAVTENGGVVNAARMSAYGERGLFGPQLLPLAPGAAVVVQGVHFASGERMEAAGFPLPTMLGGARVLIDGAAVPLMAVGPRRIEAQLPWALGGEAVAAGGLALASVAVESGGESSWPRRFWVGPYAPGVFTVSGEGQGQAAAMFAGTTDLAAPLGFSAGSRPARAGDVLEIYATGLGAVEPPLADGMNSCAPDGVCLEDGSNAVLRHTIARPRVWIGAYAVSPENVRFSGLAPDMAGVNLVVVEIPRNLTPSNAAELRLAAAGRSSQSGATIAVE